MVKVTELLHIIFGRKADAGASALAAFDAEPLSSIASAQQTATAVAPDLPDALREDIIQYMWGAGWHVPEGEVLTTVMTKPSALRKEMSVLDLSAGLGVAGRMLVAAYKNYVDGMEPDGDLAKAGMELSLAKGMGKTALVVAYDLQNFTATKRHYDAIIMREIFFRIANKSKFTLALKACFNTGGQMSWTDYCLNDADRSQPVIAAWLARDPHQPQPLGFDAALKFWDKAGYDVRISEERTAEYM